MRLFETRWVQYSSSLSSSELQVSIHSFFRRSEVPVLFATVDSTLSIWFTSPRWATASYQSDRCRLPGQCFITNQKDIPSFSIIKAFQNVLVNFQRKRFRFNLHTLSNSEDVFRYLATVHDDKQAMSGSFTTFHNLSCRTMFSISCLFPWEISIFFTNYWSGNRGCSKPWSNW